MFEGLVEPIPGKAIILNVSMGTNIFILVVGTSLQFNVVSISLTVFPILFYTPPYVYEAKILNETDFHGLQHLISKVSVISIYDGVIS